MAQQMGVVLMIMIRASLCVLVAFSVLAVCAPAQAASEDIEAFIEEIEPKVISWRRDIHQHPELGI